MEMYDKRLFPPSVSRTFSLLSSTPRVSYCTRKRLNKVVAGEVCTSFRIVVKRALLFSLASCFAEKRYADYPIASFPLLNPYTFFRVPPESRTPEIPLALSALACRRLVLAIASLQKSGGLFFAVIPTSVPPPRMLDFFLSSVQRRLLNASPPDSSTPPRKKKK